MKMNHKLECNEFARFVKEMNVDLDDDWLIFDPKEPKGEGFKNFYLLFCPFCGKKIQDEGMSQ